MPTLFDPIRIGAMDLPHRAVMAPLTRNRTPGDHAPTELNAQYYAQRAGAGLIVSEGTQPSGVGQGYLDTPGIHTPAQVEGWRRVADGVHERGGHLFIQLMHAGRIAHPDNKDGLETVAPSALAAPGEMVTADGQQPHPVPRALETGEIPSVVAEFVHAARCAVEAGADGVEVHSANGYLLHQFLAPSSNQRTDEYGDSPAARARLTIEVVTAVAEAIGCAFERWDGTGLPHGRGGDQLPLATRIVQLAEMCEVHQRLRGTAGALAMAEGRLRALVATASLDVD